MPLTQPTTTATRPYANVFPPCNAPTDPLAEHLDPSRPSDRHDHRPDIPSTSTDTTNKPMPLKQNRHDHRPDIPSISTDITNKPMLLKQPTTTTNWSYANDFLMPLKPPPTLRVTSTPLIPSFISLPLFPRPPYPVHRLNLALSVVFSMQNSLPRRSLTTILEFFPDHPG